MRVRGGCQVEMSLKRDPARFPFSLFAAGGFPISFGILPLLPSCYPALAGFIGMEKGNRQQVQDRQREDGYEGSGRIWG